MRKKRVIDLILCCMATAVIILCDTYMEQTEQRNLFYVVEGALLLTFAVFAFL